MNQQQLMRFVRYIIETSPDSNSASLALNQLKDIVSGELSADALGLLCAAIGGVHDDMRLISQHTDSADSLKSAAERAHLARLRQEEAMRQGRC